MVLMEAMTRRKKRRRNAEKLKYAHYLLTAHRSSSMFLFYCHGFILYLRHEQTSLKYQNGNSKIFNILCFCFCSSGSGKTGEAGGETKEAGSRRCPAGRQECRRVGVRFSFCFHISVPVQQLQRQPLFSSTSAISALDCPHVVNNSN